MSISRRTAHAILDRMLSIDPEVRAVSIMERNGNILAAKSEPSFSVYLIVKTIAS